jgi:hypothetical protein
LSSFPSPSNLMKLKVLLETSSMRPVVLPFISGLLQPPTVTSFLEPLLVVEL